MPALRQYAAQPIEYAQRRRISRPTCGWLTKFLFHFSMRQPLVQTFPKVMTDISERNHGSGGMIRSRIPYTLADTQNNID